MVKKTERERAPILGLAVLLVPAVLCSLSIGRFSMPPAMVFRVLSARFTGEGVSVQADNVIFIIRLPRIFLSMLVGAALSLSGAAYQSLFRNPMVSPEVLGNQRRGFRRGLGDTFKPSLVLHF